MGALLFWKMDDGSANFAVFDVTTSEGHEGTTTITEHPVEDGPNVSDHARSEAERITIEAFISNKPLWSNLSIKEIREDGWAYQSVKLEIPDKPSSFTPTPGGVTQAIVNAVNSFMNPQPDKATILKARAPRNRPREAYEKIEEARLKHRLIRVETSLREYDSMMIERLSVPRSVENGSGETFQIDLKRIRIVKSESVDAPEPTEARGGSTQSKGSKSAKDSDKESEKKKTIAAGLFDGAKDLLGF